MSRKAHRQAFLERLFRQNEFAMKLGLDNMRRALQTSGNPHLQHQRITIAGTNGKGSVASAIHAVLHQLGESTGLFTSPHLVDFSERIRIDGRRIADEALLRIGPQVLARFGGGPGQYKGGTGSAGKSEDEDTTRSDEEHWRALLPDPVRSEDTTLTYFELATLMAVLAFADANVSTAVYEVGLGGRLDATNALEPTVSVVTSIGLDHQKWLGDTVEEIAAEKAGIFRAGRPAVIGSRTATDTLVGLAEDVGTEPILVLGRDYDTRILPRGAVIEIHNEKFTIAGARAPWEWDNAATALAAVWAHRAGELPGEDAVVGLKRAHWPGRLHCLDLPNGLTVVLDAAHNPPAAEALLRAWPMLSAAATIEPEAVRPVVLLYGAMGDKDVENVTGVLSQLPGLIHVVVVQIDNPRAAGAEEITERTGIALAGVPLDQAGGIRDGVERALEVAPAGAMLLVTGSIYLLGEAIALLGYEKTLESTIVPYSKSSI